MSGYLDMSYMNEFYKELAEEQKTRLENKQERKKTHPIWAASTGRDRLGAAELAEILENEPEIESDAKPIHVEVWTASGETYNQFLLWEGEDISIARRICRSLWKIIPVRTVLR